MRGNCAKEGRPTRRERASSSRTRLPKALREQRAPGGLSPEYSRTSSGGRSNPGATPPRHSHFSPAPPGPLPHSPSPLLAVVGIQPDLQPCRRFRRFFASPNCLLHPLPVPTPVCHLLTPQFLHLSATYRHRSAFYTALMGTTHSAVARKAEGPSPIRHACGPSASSLLRSEAPSFPSASLATHHHPVAQAPPAAVCPTRHPTSSPTRSEMSPNPQKPSELSAPLRLEAAPSSTLCTHLLPRPLLEACDPCTALQLQEEPQLWVPPPQEPMPSLQS